MEKEDLYKKILDTEHGESDLRRLAVREKLSMIEELAVMPTQKICRLLKDNYHAVYLEEGKFGFIPKNDYYKVINMIRMI